MNLSIRSSQKAAAKSHVPLSRNQLVLILLLGFELFLVSCYAVTTLYTMLPLAFANPLRVWFDLDGEQNVPTLFSALQLSAIAVVWFQVRPSSAVKIPRRFFLVTGAAFVFLAIDESLQVHEHVRHWLRTLDAKVLMGLFPGIGPWLILYVLAAPVFLAYTAPQWIDLWKYARTPLAWIGFGAAIFVLGAVVLEASSHSRFDLYPTPFWYHVEVAVEEFSEMAGASLLLFGVLELKRLLPAQE